MAPFLKKITYYKGEIIFGEGDYANEMFFIRSGSIGYAMPDSPKYLPFLVVNKGNYFGEVDMIFY